MVYDKKKNQNDWMGKCKWDVTPVLIYIFLFGHDSLIYMLETALPKPMMT